MGHYTLNDVAQAFPEASFDQGWTHHRNRQVRDMEFHENGRRLTGNVLGNHGLLYEQSVRILNAGRGGARISGSCTCHAGSECRHIAALLIEGLARPETRIKGDVLEPGFLGWVGALEEAVQSDANEEYAASVRHRMIYVLRLDADAGGRAEVRAWLKTVRLRKDGSLGRSRDYDVLALDRGPIPKYLKPVDTRIISRLAGARASRYLSPGAGHPLHDEEGHDVLALILQTGRCRWGEVGGPALSPGPSRKGGLEWEFVETGAQNLRVLSDPPATCVLPVTPPRYVDAENGSCGVVDIGVPPKQAATLANAPPIPPESAAAARREIEARFPDGIVPMPKTFASVRESDVRPVPFLRLAATEVEMFFDRWEPELYRLPVARAGFDYGHCRFEPGDGVLSKAIHEDGDLIVVSRDRKFEDEAFRRLAGFGFVPLGAWLRDVDPRTRRPPGASFHGNRDLVMNGHDDMTESLLYFFENGLPKLKAEGWRVEVSEDYPLAIAQVEDEWRAEIEEGSGIDWFGFSLGVIVDGEKVNLLPLLVQLLDEFPTHEDLEGFLERARDGNIYMSLDNGKLLPLPMARMRPMLSTLFDLFAVNGLDDEGRIPVHARQAAEIADLERELGPTDLRWSCGSALVETGRKLRAFGSIAETSVPDSFQGALRPYQQAGLNWLQFLREFEFGGILADDMGLGKTIQTIAHVLVEKESGRMDGPCLIVAPTSLMANWRIEIERFAPRLKVLTLHGADRKSRFGEIAGHDVVLTTYPLLPRDRAALLATSYYLVILDEAQAIKNSRTKIASTAKQLKSRYRVTLTGTPMENHLGDLWSQFDFLMPGLLGDERQFRKAFRTPIEKRGDEGRRSFLGRRVAPFLLRRLKEDVAADLPSKTDIVEHVEMGEAQRDLYEIIRLAMHEKVQREIANKGVARSHIIILEALLRLRQVCCDPRLVKNRPEARNAQSAKLSRLMEMLPELIEEGRRVLLFSQFTSMLELIEGGLREREIDFVKLVGNTRDRASVVRNFQSESVPLFLISLKAGGTGLNLTAADTVIHYDPWWNPSVEAQATDRAHRIGQDKPVFVYRLLTLGTVEERILELQDRKRALMGGVVKTNATGQLSAEDVDALLAPLS